MRIFTAQPACQHCQFSPICSSEGLPVEAIRALESAIDQHQEIAKQSLLVRSGDHLDYLYLFRNGSAKAWKIDNTARERIMEFYLPGELIGLEAIGKKRYPFNISTLENSHICRVHYKKFHKIINQYPQLQSHLLTLASNKLNQSTNLFNSEAELRLLEFLKDLQKRLSCETPHGKNQIKLCMSRADLGNYLDLTPETISRLFTRLQQQGILHSKGKLITFMTDSNQ